MHTVTESPAKPDSALGTHEVFNQSTPIEPINHYLADVPLQEAVARHGAAWATGRLTALGEIAGSPETRAHSQRAESNEPKLITHDRFGHRVDQVELDPSWHALLKTGIEHQTHSLPWRDYQDGAHVARAALFGTWSHSNGGVMCPISMTHAVIPPLRNHAPQIAAEWEDRLTMADYENGAIAGMA